MEKINQLFWIYKSKINSAGKAPIYLRVSSKSGKFQLSTGVFVVPRDWDSIKQKVRGNSPKSLLANSTLKAYTTKVGAALLRIVQNHEEFSVSSPENRTVLN